VEKLRWGVAVIAAALVLVVGGTWVYLNLIRDEPPPPLALEATTTTTTEDPGEPAEGTTTSSTATAQAHDDVSGTWVPTSESVVGYRVGEVLFGQRAEGVGRTNGVDGRLVIDETTVTSAEFVADMATVTSDDSRRDNQFRGRIMDVATHPDATIRLVDPIELGGVPPDGEVIEVSAMIELTLRGSTRAVPVDVRARRNGPLIEINGSIQVVFEEWGIPNPSTVGITTDDEGDLEFLLVLARA
jgi:polyisoprenoid-binding protein YceI